MSLKLRKRAGKPRYAKQQDTYSCGPVALLNTLKWRGYNATLKDLPKLRGYCKATPEKKGCGRMDFDKALIRFSKIHAARRDRPNMRMINKHLDRHGLVLVLISTRLESGEIDGHYFVVLKRVGNWHKVLNFRGKNGPTTEWIRLGQEFRKAPKVDGYPIIWLVSFGD